MLERLRIVAAAGPFSVACCSFVDGICRDILGERFGPGTEEEHTGPVVGAAIGTRDDDPMASNGSDGLEMSSGGPMTCASGEGLGVSSG